MAEILSVEQMYDADRLAMQSGVPGPELMEAAGRAMERVVRAGWSPRPVCVLCGPGNNGGDGFVVARLLAARGWPVTVALLGDRASLRGDAALNAGRWTGPLVPLAPEALGRASLVVDALFGAGLARPLDGPAAAAVSAVNAQNLACVAADIPSGVHGDTGEVSGIAPRCAATVTFFRPKPGHLLRPGRDLCGRLTVADIGIPTEVLDDIRPQTLVNVPQIWGTGLPRVTADSHKYSRGHLVIRGGEMTGAARLAARAARRAGAGLVTLAVPTAMFEVYAGDAPGAIVRADETAEDFARIIGRGRLGGLLIGPGAGLGKATRRRVEIALAYGCPTVLDADALTAFAEDPQCLFGGLRGDCVLTPHDGEFARLFDLDGDRLTRARAAAAACGAVVLLKGADTVVAAPDGRAAITPDAPPSLATGGSGDVLAGLIAGLAVQGMPAFEAACAGAWLHAEAARRGPAGLIAEDLPELIGPVIRDAGGTI